MNHIERQGGVSPEQNGVLLSEGDLDVGLVKTTDVHCGVSVHLDDESGLRVHQLGPFREKEPIGGLSIY